MSTQKLQIRRLKYKNGTLCVVFDGQKLSVNIPSYALLKPGEFAVKNWSENKDLAQRAFKSGLFEDMKRDVPTGHVRAPIWRIRS